MKYLFLFILMLFLLPANYSMAQMKWTEHAQDRVFVIKVDTNQHDSDSWSYTYISISICDQVTGQFLQGWKGIELPNCADYYKDALMILEDINFDGFMDFRVMVSWFLNGAQTEYDCCLFNPSTDKYEWNKSASAMQGMDLIPHKKLIHTQWRYGFESYGHAVYHWKGSELVCVGWEEDSFVGDGYVPSEKPPLDTIYKVESTAGFMDIMVPHEKCHWW